MSDEILKELFLNAPRLRAEILGYTDLEPFHDELFAHLERRYPRCLYLLPRGSFKSSLITVSYTVGEILKNRNLRVLIDSEVHGNAIKHLSEIKQHLTMNPLIHHLFGDLKTDPGWKETAITVAGRTKPHREPTIDTTGADVEKTGMHYDKIILDDVVGDQNVNTVEAREKTWDHIRKLFPILEPGGQMILVGTRWHVDDSYGKIMYNVVREGNSFGFETMIRPARNMNGTLLLPGRLNQKYLDLQRTLLGPYSFSAQYMLDPVPSERRVFLPEWIERNYWRKTEELPVGEKRHVRAMTVDPALGEDRKNCLTAITIADHSKAGDIYVLECAAGHWSPEETVQQIMRAVVRWEPDRWGMEEIAFQRVFRIWIQREFSRMHLRCPLVEFKTSHVRKELRIEKLQPVAARGQLHLMKGQYELEAEMLGYPEYKTRDRCFISGTKIATKWGDKNIEDVRAGDMVLTPVGLRRVSEAFCTGKRNVVCRIGLTGTSDHPVFVHGKGLRRLDALSYNDETSNLSLKEAARWVLRRLSNFREFGTDLERREDIISGIKAAGVSTAIRGNFSLARKFLRNIMFTIRTVTVSITALKTWSVYRLASILQRILRGRGAIEEERCWFTWKRSGEWLPAGTEVPLESSGMRETLGWLGKKESRFAGNANSAESGFGVGIETLSFAREVALRPTVVCPVDGTKPGPVVFVEPLSPQSSIFQKGRARKSATVPLYGKQEEVWNLTVEGAGMYYANGILVSNCDSLAYQVELSPNVRFKVQQKELSWLEKINMKWKSSNATTAQGGGKWFR